LTGAVVVVSAVVAVPAADVSKAVVAVVSAIDVSKTVVVVASVEEYIPVSVDVSGKDCVSVAVDVPIVDSAVVDHVSESETVEPNETMDEDSSDGLQGLA
jgi:hypothetical protein